MKAVVSLAVMTLLTGIPGLSAAAEPYPVKPVRLVVPFAPGGSNDLMGRMIGARLHELLGQPFIIDNRGGAGSTIGIELVVRANPDGYTILTTSGGIATVTSLYKLTFNPTADLAPLAYMARMPYVLCVTPSFPARTTQELIKLARSSPGKFAYATAGAGTSTHLTSELFTSAAGIDLLHVPFKGGGPALNSVIGGETQLLFNVVTGSLPHARSGKLRALGISSGQRAEIAPDIPTIAEAGLPDFEVFSWYNMFAPAGTPRAIINRLNQSINQALEHPDTRKRMQQMGISKVGGSPEELAKYLRFETERWARLIKEKGITLK